MSTQNRIKKHAAIGNAPSIVLIDPKYAFNVAMVVRLASCYGIGQVWFTGSRIEGELAGGKRLPREERMKGYMDVEIFNSDVPLTHFRDPVPVAVEVRDGSESLHSFEHPENAVYVFGPEDGSIKKSYLYLCHRFVVIPTRHCLNLATAVATVLWDREHKELIKHGARTFATPGTFEARGLTDNNVVWRSV